MRRKAIRSLALAGALVALTVPVFSVTHNAAACSGPSGSCTEVSTSSGTFDTFISPLSVALGSVNFPELPTQAEIPPGTATFVMNGSATITVNDLRGNNQGFSVYLSCDLTFVGCMTSSQFPSGIPASDFSVPGPGTDDVMLLFGDGTGGEGIADGGLAGLTYPMPLTAPALVGGECAYEIIGKSIYAETVPVTVIFPQEELTLPVSWTTHFVVSVTENAPPGGCYSAGELDDPNTGMVVDY